jgi:hypothetical protein
MMKTLSLHMQANNGFPQTRVLSIWPLSKIKRAYISWWIYQTTKCNVIIIKIVINNNSFFERSFCASTVKFNADFTKGISY